MATKRPASYSSLAICAGLLTSVLQLFPTAAAAQSEGAPTGGALDYAYYKANVEPIFLTPREGHARCVACHSYNNSALKLQPLDKGAAKWTEEQSHKNFEAATKVAVAGNLKSPILIHPLAESAGGDFFHGGGKHFNSQNDPEWVALKSWVMGAKEH